MPQHPIKTSVFICRSFISNSGCQVRLSSCASPDSRLRSPRLWSRSGGSIPDQFLHISILVIILHSSKFIKTMPRIILFSGARVYRMCRNKYRKPFRYLPKAL